jgi:glycerol uptake facilitator protein
MTKLRVSPSDYSFSQRLMAEAIGIFFLVFVGAGTAAMTLIISKGAALPNKNNIGIGALGGAGDWLTIGLAFAFAIMTMVYIFGHVSGCHINPCVTLALLVRREILLGDALGYWVAQFVGAIAGAFAIALVYGHQAWEVGGLGAAGPFPGVSLWQAGFAEGIGTFGLVLGVYGTAVNKKAPKGWAGLILSLNVAGLIIFLGNVSGAAINPARALGPIFGDWVLGSANDWAACGVYILAEVIGALLAAAVYPAVAMHVKRGVHDETPPSALEPASASSAGPAA